MNRPKKMREEIAHEKIVQSMRDLDLKNISDSKAHEGAQNLINFGKAAVRIISRRESEQIQKD